MSVTVGQLAPDFSLPASTGGEVSLKDLRGKHVVLYFYPKDNTPGCTTEACSFRDLHPDFQGVEAEIIGISTDSLKSHDKFIAKHQLPFVLLSDEEHQVCELYGVWKEKSMCGRKYMGIERTTFVIDREGIVRQVYPKVKVADHGPKVLQFIKENLA